VWAEVNGLMSDAVRDGVVPGCALCVRDLDEVLFLGAAGHAELRPRTRPVQPGLAWDLASLTKVLATTAIAVDLVRDGALDLDAPIREALGAGPPGVTARHLLQHTSGLPAWDQLAAKVDAAGRPWGTSETRSWVMEAALSAPVEAAPGSRHRYSDLGFLALGALLERVGGERLDRLFEARVRAPTGADLRWGWPGAAATEDCPVRGRVLVGEVHDLNAAAMGGIAPHAGLFGAPEAVAAAGAGWISSWQGGDEALRLFWSARGAGSHVMGWDGVTKGGSTAGDRWPLDGVGHLGFTGCSLWLAPRQGISVALVSNRVHPEVEGGAVPNAPLTPRIQAFRALRPRLHTAIVDALHRAGRWRDVG
jgi:serine-type D-Ala-D-Ala carboxypeptidase